MRLFATALVLLPLVACNVTKDETGDPVVDADGDGYLSTDDCDDDDAAVRPGADERCNGVDDDCDGIIDEEPVDGMTVYRDVDGDGWGVEEQPEVACGPSDGWAEYMGDCDDREASIYPGAEEYCDDVDQDCDGDTDDAEAVDATAWYLDEDGDEFGATGSAEMSCTRIHGRVAQGGDCDDADATVNPDAEEICNDGIDNDCQAGLDPCVQPLEAADTRLLGVAAGDHAGVAVVGCGDLDGDGLDDVAVGAEYVDLGASTPDAGAVYVVYGPVPKGDLSLADADLVITGEAGGDQAGTFLDGRADVNGDGLMDLLVAGKKNQAGIGTATGAAYLFYGPVLAPTGSLADADVKLHGDSTYDFAGIYLSFAGDVDGDGFDDLMVAANNDDPGARGNAGTVFLTFGGPGLGDRSLAMAEVELQGETAYDYAGVPASAGDLDGDGLEDVMVGVSQQDLGGASADAGRVYVFFGATLAEGGNFILSEADAIFQGARPGDQLGVDLASAGDTDGDGHPDLLIAANRADNASTNAGTVYLVSGVSVTPGLVSDLSGAMATFLGEESEEQLGTKVAGGTDFDGDGVLDFLTSAADGRDRAGATYLFLGPASGSRSASEADVVYAGEQDGDISGISAEFAGDVYGTGQTDVVLIGGTQNDVGGADAGAAWLVSGLAE